MFRAPRPAFCLEKRQVNGNWQAYVVAPYTRDHGGQCVHTLNRRVKRRSRDTMNDDIRSAWQGLGECRIDEVAGKFFNSDGYACTCAGSRLIHVFPSFNHHPAHFLPRTTPGGRCHALHVHRIERSRTNSLNCSAVLSSWPRRQFIAWRLSRSFCRSDSDDDH